MQTLIPYKTIMKNTLFFLFILFSLSSQSQISVAGIKLSKSKTVYTITTKNGTTYQTKDYGEKHRELRFKTLEGEKKKILLSQVNKIVSKGKKERDNYTVKYIKYSKSRSTLMKEMIVGKVSLYMRVQTSMGAPNSMGMTSTRSDISYYVKKEGQLIAKYIKGNNIAYGRFKTNAIKFFEDCETLVAKLKKNKYKRKHLEDIVRFYIQECQ